MCCAVPGLPNIDVAQTEIRRQVDNFSAAIQKYRYCIHRNGMWRREKYEIAVCEIYLAGILEHQVNVTSQTWE